MMIRFIAVVVLVIMIMIMMTALPFSFVPQQLASAGNNSTSLQWRVVTCATINFTSCGGNTGTLQGNITIIVQEQDAG